MTVSHPASPVVARDVDAATEALRDRGLRVSAARRLVLEALFAAGEPVSAERIADGLGGRFTPLDVASVYRNLELLEELGLVRHFHLGHGPGLYALAGQEREYLVCESCKSLRSLERHELDGVRRLVREGFGFEASFAHFPIVGLCERCSGRPGAADEPAPGRGSTKYTFPQVRSVSAGADSRPDCGRAY